MGYVQQILLHKITNFIYKICNNEINGYKLSNNI